MLALRCAGIEDDSKKRTCFNKLDRKYHIFDQTRMFDNSLQKMRDYKMVACERLHETYKFLAVSIISMAPEKFGFDIQRVEVDNEKMKLYNPYSPHPYGGYALAQ